MDFYNDDIDSLLQTGGDELNQNINDDNEPEQNDDENGDAESDAADGDGSKPKTVEPKRRTVKNPQFRLNVERLKSDRGIIAIDSFFKDIKFRGKGHESDDLNNVLKRLEHWSHRCFAKFNFDDFLATCDKLGRKKQIQTYMNLYRQGMLEEVHVNRELADDDEANDGNPAENATNVEEPIDEFDYLIDQQIEKYKTLPPKTPSSHDKSMGSSIFSTPNFADRQPIHNSTPMSDIYPLELTPKQPQPPPVQPERRPLTAEEMARIAENRRLAQERLRAKREALQQKQQQMEVQTIPEESESMSQSQN